jgi:alpha-beta hydrolase superfamily lysophospholipase
MILSAVLLAAAVGVRAAPPKTVTFKTDDGWTIAASYAPAKKDHPTAILVHGVAAGRGEYAVFASSLQARGWGTLAIDLRGHGDSTAGPRGAESFELFDGQQEWPKAVYDVLAAERFLESKGVTERQVVLIGASIGANLCAMAFSAMPNARSLVLLSPGVNYRGAMLPSLDPKRTILAASPGDTYAFVTIKNLTMIKDGVKPAFTVLLATGGHGAQMFSDPQFTRDLLKRLRR